MKELIKFGHKVTLIGHPNSQVSSFGIKLIPFKDSWTEQIPQNTDCVHLFYPPEKKIPFPHIITIGGNGQVGEKFPLNTVFVSKSHAKIHGSNNYVDNALDLEEYPFKAKKINWKNFFFLAKGSWKVKNLKQCVKACKKNKVHLSILGGRSYIPSRYTKSYGSVDNIQKLKILENMDALLFPVRWNEPFGLAIIESMSQGLPVIGSPFGSLPDLIKKECGIIVQNYNELEEVLSSCPRSFDPYEIRNYVETNFSLERMTKEYLQYYEKAMKGPLSKRAPQRVLTTNPQDLLNF